MDQDDAQMTVARGHVPDHVPHDLVTPFDLFGDPAMRECPFAVMHKVHEDSPRIFWSALGRRGGGQLGNWVLTRAEDMRYVLNNPDLFSSKGVAGFSALVGESWDMIPLELDPPEHTMFRKVLNPILYPRVVSQMTPGVIARAVELIDTVKDQGGCEFMQTFGRPFPVSIFMQLLGLPAEQTDTFLDWEARLLHGADIETRVQAAKAIRDYLKELAAERRANPVDDLTSFVVQAEVQGRKFTDDEVMGTLYLLFVGGLDTVASSLGFYFHFLATHPEKQRELREAPEKIERAVEELLRRFSVVNTNRKVTRDIELHGVQMKAGDWIAVPYSLGSLDPEEFSCPMEVDFDRSGSRHFGFAYGPHFCIGSHLARRELAVALREWLVRIPEFRVKPGSKVEKHGGGVFGIEHLELEW
jgi:cytochrome P450